MVPASVYIFVKSCIVNLLLPKVYIQGSRTVEPIYRSSLASLLILVSLFTIIIPYLGFLIVLVRFRFIFGSLLVRFWFGFGSFLVRFRYVFGSDC